MRRFCWPRRQRCTATRWCTRNRRATGATSTRSVLAAATTRRSGARRHSPWPITARTASTPASSASSKRTARACRCPAGAQCRTSLLQTSPSELYPYPLVHPQPESYWGNVNPIGPRGCYDEAKRCAEAFAMAYHRAHGVDTRIIRIFNTHGPRMQVSDGRAVPNFMAQAIRGEPLTVYGDGSQTRSLCYVSDLVRGVLATLEKGDEMPVNLGNPEEVTVLELEIGRA